MTDSTAQEPRPLLHMDGIRKTFGPVVALDGVDLTVGRNEVHGLLGGNGAGKTTLMNVLYGLYRPDAGTVTLDAAEVVIRDPRDAIAHGIGMVHQNFLQVDTYSVTENIVLGTVEGDGARVGAVEAVEDVHEGRLAGAVAAEQAVDLVAPDREVDAAEGHDRPERLAYAVHVQERAGRLHGAVGAVGAVAAVDAVGHGWVIT